MKLVLNSVKFVTVGLVLALPLFLGLLIIAAGISNYSVLVFYLLIALEGLGILYWAISNVRIEERLKNILTPSRAYVYPDRNRAKVIASFIKSGTKRQSFTRQLCREEISRVVEGIIEETPELSAKLDAKTHEALIQDSKELNFVLHPPDANKVSPDPSPNLDYIQSLDHVVSKLQARW